MKNVMGWAACMALAAIAATEPVRAQCAEWRTRPVIRGLGEVLDMTEWDPDGAGPQPSLLIVAGNFDHAGEASGQPAHNIVAYNGTGWSLLGNGVTNGGDLAYVSAVTVYDGDLIAAGYFPDAGGVPCANIARWDGEAWHPLGSGIGGDSTASVQSLTVYHGELIAGGIFETAGGAACNNIARWDGVTWRPLSTGLLNGAVYSLTVYGDTLVAGGAFESAEGIQVRHVASWDGAHWHAFGTGIETWVAVVSTYNGELVAGRFAHFDSDPRDTVVRWDGANWQSLGGGVGTAPQSGAMSMTVYNNELIVGGYYTTEDGAAGNYISRWNGSTWRSLGAGADNTVEALAGYNDQLFAGGTFETAGNLTVESIARWNGTNWLDIVGVSLGPGGTVYSLTPWAGGMVIGGSYIYSSNGIANNSTINLAFFDGRSVSELENAALPAGFSWVTAMATAPGDAGSTDLIVGGFLTSIGGTSVNNIARLNDTDGTGWQPLGAGLNGDIWAITYFNGRIYAAGNFTASGIAPLNHMASWNGSTWTAVGPGPITGVNGEIHAMKGFTANPTTASLVVGGSFTSAGGVAANSIAVFNQGTVTNQSSWSALGAGFNSFVRAIERYNGSIYAAGDFTASGSTQLNHIARWDSSAWVPVGNGMDGPVYSLTISNGTLIAGGDFSTAGGVAARHLARWDGAAWTSIGGHTEGPVYALATLQDEIHIGGMFERVRNGVLHSPIWARYSEHGVPWIATQPESAERPCHTNFVPGFHPAQGYGGLVYQWRKDGVPLVNGPTGTGSTIVGATGNFAVVNVSREDEGEYDCVLSNGCGEVTSLPATLTVAGTCLRGDMNCDGVVNNFDIDPFVLALTSPSAYAAAFPDCDVHNGDVNVDGAVNNFDIDAFTDLISGG